MDDVVVAGSGCIEIKSGVSVDGESSVDVIVEVCGNSDLGSGGGFLGMGGASVVVMDGGSGVGVGGGVVVWYVSLPVSVVALSVWAVVGGMVRFK